MASIDTQILKTIRTSRKIGREKLAKLTGLTERQIAKLESAACPTDVAETWIFRLSLALDVPEAVLTGEVPASDIHKQPLPAKACGSGCCG